MILRDRRGHPVLRVTGPIEFPWICLSASLTCGCAGAPTAPASMVAGSQRSVSEGFPLARPSPPNAASSSSTTVVREQGSGMWAPSGTGLPPGDPAVIRMNGRHLRIGADDLVVANDGVVSSLDSAGHWRWSHGVHGSIHGIARTREGVVTVTTKTGEVSSLDLGNGRLLWRRQLGPGALSNPVPGAGGRIRVLRDDGWVYELDSSGTEVCRAFADTKTADIDAAVGEVACGPALPRTLEATGTPQWFGFGLELGEPVTSVASVSGGEVMALHGGEDPRAWIRHRAKWSEAPRITLPLGEYRFLWADRAVIGSSAATILVDLSAGGCCADPGDSTTIVLELRDGRWKGHRDLASFFRKHPHRQDSGGNLSQILMQGNDVLSCSFSPDEHPELGPMEDPPALTICRMQKQGIRAELPKAPLRATGSALLAGIPWLVGVVDSGKAVALRFDGRSWIDMSLPDLECEVTAFSAGPQDLWVGTLRRSDESSCDASATLMHWDGRAWTKFASPLLEVIGIWGSAPNDVWAAGDKGLAHFDGMLWRLAMDVPGPCHALSGSGAQFLWAACDSGVWRRTSNPPTIETGFPGTSTLTRISWPQKFELETLSSHAYPVHRTRVSLENGSPLDGAAGVAQAQDGNVWLLSDNRLVRVLGSTAKVLANLPLPPTPGGADVLPLMAGRFIRFSPSVSRPATLVPSAGLAPTTDGRGWLLWRGSLWRIQGDQMQLESQQLPGLLALDAHGDTCWMASSSPSWTPKVMVVGTKAPRILGYLPQAAYAAIHATSTDGLWLAGGTGNLDAEMDSKDSVEEEWPAGEGIVVHAQGASLREIRIPSGAMLALRSVGPGEAWAAGVAGTLVHIHHEHVTSYAVSPGRLIRAIWASSPNEVWFAGDMPWLLLWNGRELRRVDLRSELGAFGSVAGLAAHDSDPLWVASPNGLLRGGSQSLEGKLVNQRSAFLVHCPGPSIFDHQISQLRRRTSLCYRQS